MTVVSSAFGLTVPLRVAEVVLIFVTESVLTVGGEISVIIKKVSSATFVKVCTIPLGQSILIESGPLPTGYSA